MGTRRAGAAALGLGLSVGLFLGLGGVATGADETPVAAERGASPGNERGPGSFVQRGAEHGVETFYAAAGGQLWYYLNLYYWVPKPVLEEHGATDLWIREEVVASVRDLRRWPKGEAVPDPEAKVTLEYWKVGASGRTLTIDNHKDFWMESANLCSGRIDVSMTLRVGRLRERGRDGAWRAPAAAYVLERRNYGPATKAPPPELRFEPLPGDPVSVWEYSIPWSAGSGKFLRSNWKSLPMPTLRNVRNVRGEAPPRAGPPVVTDDR